jgi:8-oxo-dGTP diphosphatase
MGRIKMGRSNKGREYPKTPLLGVGAVVLRRGKVLLVCRAQEPCKGEWTFPGGLVELGETLREAAERETYEETGIHIRAGEVLEVVDSLVKGTGGRLRFHYSIIDVVCKYLSGSARAGDDVSEVAWVPVNEALRMPLAGVTRQVLKKALSK